VPAFQAHCVNNDGFLAEAVRWCKAKAPSHAANP